MESKLRYGVTLRGLETNSLSFQRSKKNFKKSKSNKESTKLDHSFFSRFPFYYEIKIILVIWLLSPATKGSSILYRKFVHPTLSSREQVGFF